MVVSTVVVAAQSSMRLPETTKPIIHGKHWMAITGKPLAATAGSMIFQKGGNAVDAACAMLAATCTMWDVLSWGGETQALIYNPKTKKVIAINAMGVAPTGATPEFFKAKKMNFPPDKGPLAATTPGTPGGLMTMLAEYGRLSLKEVLAPAMSMAEGYPIERTTAESINRSMTDFKDWPYSKKIFELHPEEKYDKGPKLGEIFKQKDLLATLQKLVDAEEEALKAGKTRAEAIYAAYDRFYKGDIAKEFSRSCIEQGGLITTEDLANWKVLTEEPVMTTYRDIEVYKMREWTQGPVLLQALNMVEKLGVAGLGYNSPDYIHFLYQVMNLSYADRDFYYGDPYFPPEEPIKGLLSKEYAAARIKLLDRVRNPLIVRPGDPYPFEGKTNPYKALLDGMKIGLNLPKQRKLTQEEELKEKSDFYMGTTSVQAADTSGWVVSITPSGGWVPAVVAGNTGIGMSQRMQSFNLDTLTNPFNKLVPGKRPRVTLTPSMALKNGKPFLAFGVQGGDSQDQNLLQFFLNVVEFDMDVQQACEAENFNSFQMRSSFGGHSIRPGDILVNSLLSEETIKTLESKGYKVKKEKRTSGPITAIYFDQKNGTMWGGASNHGDDYGIGW
jgi:gamma-glutamyltranspeptidase/glutathione hydrolase